MLLNYIARELSDEEMVCWISRKQAVVDGYSFYIVKSGNYWVIESDSHSPQDFGVENRFSTLSKAQDFLQEQAEYYAHCVKENMAYADSDTTTQHMSNELTKDRFGWMAPIRFIHHPIGNRCCCVFIPALNQWVGEGTLVDSGYDAAILTYVEAAKCRGGRIFDLREQD